MSWDIRVIAEIQGRERLRSHDLIAPDMAPQKVLILDVDPDVKLALEEFLSEGPYEIYVAPYAFTTSRAFNWNHVIGRAVHHDFTKFRFVLKLINRKVQIRGTNDIYKDSF